MKRFVNKQKYNWEQARYNFLHWLSKKVAKTPEATVPPKWIRVIQSILFPFHAMYVKQSQVKYDWQTNTYAIQRIKLSGSVFKILDYEANTEGVFQFYKDEFGVIQLKRYKPVVILKGSDLTHGITRPGSEFRRN